MNKFEKKWSSIKRRVNLFVKPLFFKVFRYTVECNICHWRDYHFFSDDWHPETICPKCNSQVRQRLFWASVRFVEALGVKKVLKDKEILHFAPDQCLVNLVSKQSHKYLTADLLMDGYNYDRIDLNIDISSMNQIGDGEFDCVIALDVLEHVSDHLKAIEETNRILRLGGHCIFTIPQKDNLRTTIEDLSITDPKERELKFGQWDHLRIYGTDFKRMLEDRGFEVTVVTEQDIDIKYVEKYVLAPPILSEHPLATNYRRVYFGKKVI